MDARTVGQAAIGLPHSIFTVAVQKLLHLRGIRLSIIKRLEDRAGAAIFEVVRLGGSGKSVGLIAVPYCSYTMRTVLLSVLGQTSWGKSEMEWHPGGRPGTGAKLLTFFAGLERCVVTWPGEVQAMWRSQMEALGHTFSSEALSADAPSRLVVDSLQFDLPQTSACEAVATAMSGGYPVVNAQEMDSLCDMLDCGLGVTVSNEMAAISGVSRGLFQLSSKRFCGKLAIAA